MTKRFKLELECENEAFDSPRELTRILRDVARDVATASEELRLELGGNVYDVNGNTVGHWSYQC